MKYERLKGLKEWNFGLFEGESEDLNPKHPNEITYGNFFVNFGGESNKEVEKRMRETLTEIMEKDGNNTFLAVNHGGTYFFLKNAPDVPFTGLPNCAIFKYEYEMVNLHLPNLLSTILQKKYN